MNESKYPLLWPEGWKRTRINSRVRRGQWKKTLLQYQKELVEELNRVGALAIVVSMNEMSLEKRDPGVAVYFTKPPSEKDTDWQDTLGIDNPTPTVAEIDDRFKELARKYHPDNQTTGNYEMYKKIDSARKTAKAWATGQFGKDHEHVIACDKYEEIRLNIKAIQVSIAAIRKIEESGASGILDRAFAGMSVPQIGESSYAARS
jgi:hypothetical protein